MTVALTVTVNGQRTDQSVEPRVHLADFLRENLRLAGTHLGCEHGVCGACTVLINGAPVRSCLIMAVACDGFDVRTIEGFDGDDTMASLRQAFSRKHALQCGFCTAGMLIVARDIVLRVPEADEKRVRNELSGNLCRCTGYAGIVNAVLTVIDERRSAREATSLAAQSQTDLLAGSVVLAPETPSTDEPTVARPVAQTFVATKRDPAKVEKVGTIGREPRPGWTRFEESFLVDESPEAVWALFGDVPRVAACLPGAALSESDGRSIKGRLAVKLGPIAANFVGSAVIGRDDAALSGTISGAGSDGASNSRTMGEVTYRLTPADRGQATRVVVMADYRLQGPLAQFSRTELAQELGRHIVSEFAANLDRSLKGGPGASAERLDAGRVLWTAMRAWIGRKLAKLRFGRM
jgi:aerobic carbon-monoxide dehydrogenase small subunit